MNRKADLKKPIRIDSNRELECSTDDCTERRLTLTGARVNSLCVMHRSMCDLRFALAAALLRLTRCLHFSTGYTTGWVSYAK